MGHGAREEEGEEVKDTSFSSTQRKGRRVKWGQNIKRRRTFLLRQEREWWEAHSVSLRRCLGIDVFTFSVISSTQFDSQDVMVPWHLQSKYRGQLAPPPPPRPPSGAKENKMRKKRKKEDKRGCANVESGSTKPDDALKAQSDLVEEGFLELSSITLSDEGESSLQLKTERPQGCHRSGQLSGPAFDSDQALIEQDQTECTLRSTTNQGVHYKATHTGSSDGRDLVTDTGTHGGGVQNTDCTGSTKTDTDTALRSSALVEQGYQTFQRYYHVFRKGELSRLFSGLEGVGVLEEFYDHENWCVLTKKKH